MRFVDTSGECWLFLGALDKYGYGRFMSNGRRFRAHRWLYERLVGPVPPGLVLDHLCRVTRCVRPAHVEPVTDKVNTHRGVGPTAVNLRKDVCIRAGTRSLATISL